MRSVAKYLAGAAVAVALVLAVPVAAEYLSIKKAGWQDTDNLASATAINSAVWTGYMCAAESRSIVLEITYVYSSGTAVAVTCETHDNPNTTSGSGFDLPQLSDSATVGTSTVAPHIWNNPISAASESYTLTVSNLPHNCLNCSLTATGGGAGDTAVVRWRDVTP